MSEPAPLALKAALSREAAYATAQATIVAEVRQVLYEWRARRIEPEAALREIAKHVGYYVAGSARPDYDPHIDRPERYTDGRPV